MSREEEQPKSRASAADLLVGEDLGPYSLEELGARITLLETEIARCRAAIDAKEGSRAAADAFFKPKD